MVESLGVVTGGLHLATGSGGAMGESLVSGVMHGVAGGEVGMILSGGVIAFFCYVMLSVRRSPRGPRARGGGVSRREPKRRGQVDLAALRHSRMSGTSADHPEY